MMDSYDGIYNTIADAVDNNVVGIADDGSDDEDD